MLVQSHAALALPPGSQVAHGGRGYASMAASTREGMLWNVVIIRQRMRRLGLVSQLLL